MLGKKVGCLTAKGIPYLIKFACMHGTRDPIMHVQLFICTAILQNLSGNDDTVLANLH